MAVSRSTAVLVLSLGFLGLAFPGCGDGDEPGLIPPDSSARLLELLDEAEQRFERGSCDGLESTLSELDREADRIPDAEVDVRLRTTLNAEIQELSEMSERCRPAEEELVPAPAPVPPPTTVPETAPAPVEPTTTEETEPSKDETKEEKPPKEEPPAKPGKPPKPPPEGKPPEEKPPAKDP